MSELTFKQKHIGNYKLHHEYNILVKNQEIGDIRFIKKEKIFIIGYLYIQEEFRKKHYGYQVIEHILSHYKINCIVGQTLYDSRGFWNKCIKKYKGQRRNISTCNNCSSSFIIPRYKIDDDTLVELLNIGHEIE